MFVVSGCDAGDFLNGRIAWDVLNRTAQHERPIEQGIDLRSTRHLKPYSIACIAALGARAQGRLPLQLPEDAACCEHVLRMGLSSYFSVRPNCEALARESNVPIRQLLTVPGDFSSRAVKLWAADATGYAVNQCRDLADHLDEMILNALGHSESPVGCFVAGQSFHGTGNVEVAILDLGITIPTHLRRNPDNAGLPLGTDREAILQSIREGITGTPHNQRNRLNQLNSGVGLHNVHELCRAGGCVLTILSGDTYISFFENDQRVFPLRNRFAGTLVNIKFCGGFNLLPDPADGILDPTAW